MNQPEKTIQQLHKDPESIQFSDIIAVIDEYYSYSPCSFSNGLGNNKIFNKAGENEGSCKIFCFAKLNKLNEQQTLNCFGQYYRDDVLKNPEASDHGNIRNFIKYGWQHIHFDEQPLLKRL